MIPPSTFSTWEYLRWLKSVEHLLYIRVINPETKQPELACLKDLHGPQWVFWAERLFMDPRALVKTQDEWSEDDKAKIPDIF